MQDIRSTDCETAYAKINLALHIIGRRDDGYHEIDTVFSFVNKGDILSVQQFDSITINIDGPFAKSIDCDEDDNLVVQAARKMQQHYQVNEGAALTLLKKLPVASGIGGGSADAAAAARLLNRHWKLNRPLKELAKLMEPLGADIPACIYSQTCQGEGIGTDILFLDNLNVKEIPILMVNPTVAVSTGPIFAKWDGQSSGVMNDISLENIKNHYHNDMQRAAISLFPVIEDVLDALQSHEPILRRMSGSGATCFALYENEQKRDAAKQLIMTQYPDWWYMSGLLK